MVTKLTARITFVSFVALLLFVAINIRATPTGFTFATGGLDLQIDSHALYNGVLVPASTWALKNLVPTADHFFLFDDVKPGDHGEATISLHTNKDAWVCLDFSNLNNEENGENEPEQLVDTQGNSDDGELAEGLEFFAWYDDGDDVFESNEKPIFGTIEQSAIKVLKDKTYTLADSKEGSAYPADETKYIGITWCAGNLTVDVVNGGTSCDGELLGNIAQTDSMSVDISFRAVPSAENQNFQCEGVALESKGNNGHGNNEDDLDCSNPGRGPKNGIEGECGDDDERGGGSSAKAVSPVYTLPTFGQSRKNH